MPFVCSNCSKPMPESATLCGSCYTRAKPVRIPDVEDYTDKTPSVGVGKISPPVTKNPAVNRYLDLYRAARLLIGIGTTVKAIGIIVGVAILLLCLFAGIAGSSQPSMFGSQQSSANAGFLFGAFVVGAVFGTFVGGVIFLLGILISAQGQILLAQADGAVHTSPFMTEQEKAKAMSIPYRPASERMKDLSSVSDEDIAAALAARGLSSPL